MEKAVENQLTEKQIIKMKQYEPEVIAIANDIAKQLDDMASLNAYLQYVDQYKKEYVYQILDKVMSIPKENIKKSRGALFTYLIHNHGGRQYFRDSS